MKSCLDIDSSTRCLGIRNSQSCVSCLCFFVTNQQHQRCVVDYLACRSRAGHHGLLLLLPKKKNPIGESGTELRADAIFVRIHYRV